MSLPISIITCDKCGEHWGSNTVWGLHKYQFPDGRQSWMDLTFSWCHDCLSFQAIEVLPTKDVLLAKHRKEQDQLVAVETAMQGWGKGMHGWWRRRFASTRENRTRQDRLARAQREVDVVEASLAWHALRRSPPRCLTCGMTAIEYVEWRQPERLQAFPHPGCGGNFTVSKTEHRIIPIRRIRIYDVEGYLLEERREVKGDTILATGHPTVAQTVPAATTIK